LTAKRSSPKFGWRPPFFLANVQRLFRTIVI